MTANTFIFTLLSFVLLSLPVTSGAQEPSSAQSMASFCAKLPRAEYADFERVAVDSEWFEVYQISEGVKAIYEPHQWQEVISYLIEGKSKALLFDTGNGIGDIEAIAKRLTNKPIAVLNSHSHYDHVGGNYAFDKVYGLNTPFTLARQAGQPNENIAIEVSEQALCKEPPTGITQHNHIGKPYKITHKVSDGSIINLGNRSLKIMHIPGHTPDAIALIDHKAGLMWTGDSFYQGPIWLYAPETDLKTYAMSLDKMIKEIPNLKALLPAHNTPWVKPEVLLRVRKGFHDMLQGKAIVDKSEEGTAHYSLPNEKGFSFLMRDEPLPYEDQH